MQLAKAPTEFPRVYVEFLGSPWQPVGLKGRAEFYAGERQEQEQ